MNNSNNWQQNTEIVLSMRLARMVIGDSLVSADADADVDVKVECVSDDISASKVWHIYIDGEKTIRKKHNSTLQFLLRNNITVDLKLITYGALPTLRSDVTEHLGYYPRTDSHIVEDDSQHYNLVDRIRVFGYNLANTYRLLVTKEDSSWS